MLSVVVHTLVWNIHVDSCDFFTICYLSSVMLTTVIMLYTKHPDWLKVSYLFLKQRTEHSYFNTDEFSLSLD